MSTIAISIISVTVIGIICAVLLSVASKVMAVEVDERAVKLRECLPGANCGACGYAGCDGYAAALAEEEGIKTNLCIPGADAVAHQIADILGVTFEDVAEQIAVVHCGGSFDNRKEKMDYHGIMTCAASKLLYGGKNACAIGCLGLGDCAKVCPNGAICIENGLARVNTRLCTGCGLCAKVCPNHIIYTESDKITTIVTCCSTERGVLTRKKCTHGCIACKKCVRECPEQAIEVVNNFAVIDYAKCSGCGKCAEVCTTKCITQASFLGIHSA
jgi:Na+-translocating ferredoxin:NAD+ oxidoreductase RNF subunit RnfB